MDNPWDINEEWMVFTCADPDKGMGASLFDGPPDVKYVESTFVANLSSNAVWNKMKTVLTILNGKKMWIFVAFSKPKYWGRFYQTFSFSILLRMNII